MVPILNGRNVLQVHLEKKIIAAGDKITAVCITIPEFFVSLQRLIGIIGMKSERVITIRIDDELYQEIQNIVKNHRYFKQSAVIRSGLQVMAELEKRGLAGKALSFYPRVDEVIALDFDIRRKVSR